MYKHSRKPVELNTSSMADIAFLLLIFSLVATTISQDKGLDIRLPPKSEFEQELPIQERNLFKIRINGNNQLLVENEVRENAEGLSTEVKAFILNNGRDASSSDSPEKAVVSVKTSRGTKYAAFISVLDELKGAYYEIYGERVGLTSGEYRKLDQNNPEDRLLYQKGKEGIPMNISIAEPDF